MFVNAITLPSAFTPGVYSPALDTTGLSNNNLVSGETQNFSPNMNGSYTSIIPSFGPFFANSLVVSRLGSNLISNPGPFTAITNWNTSVATGGYGGGALSVSGTALRLTNDSTGINYAIATYSMNTTIGTTYQITVIRGNASNNGTMGFYLGTPVTGKLATLLNNGTGTVFYFTATHTTTYLSFNTGTSSANAWAELTSVNVSQTTPMVNGVDYYYAFPFIGASRATNKPIYGGISFNNASSNITVQLAYQILGGSWLLNQAANADILASVSTNPCAIAWEQVAKYSTKFPIVTTAWDRVDPTNVVDINKDIAKLRDAIISKTLAENYSVPISHLANFSNPHNLNKASVSLNNVVNLIPASDVNARDTSNNTSYINPAQVKSMMLNVSVQANTVIKGVVKMNVGASTADGSDSTKALTAAGFTALAANPNSAIALAVNKGQNQSFVTPFPFMYPIVWNNITCPTKGAFITAVSNFLGLTSLEYSDSLGCFWFPANTPIPPLNITSS